MALKDSAFKIDIDPKTGEKKYSEDHNVPKELTYRYRVEQLFKNIEPDRIKIFDALSLENYAWFNSFSDICLCYVEHNTFNESKSSIKFIESLAYDAPCITSDFGGYSDTFKLLRENSSLDKELINKMAVKGEFNIDEWISKISFWIENHGNENIKNELIKIKEYLKDYYDIDKHVEERIAKYKGCIEKNIENQQNIMFQTENTIHSLTV